MLDVASGTETYVLMRGTSQTPKAGDMMIWDSEGIISSIVYGPDQRTQIRHDTTTAVFTVYGPAGIDATTIEAHLHEIEANAQLIAPQSQLRSSRWTRLMERASSRRSRFLIRRFRGLALLTKACSPLFTVFARKQLVESIVVS